MECCVSVCHGSFASSPGLNLKRERGVRCCGDVPRLRIAATSTLPGKSPGSSRRVSYQEPQRLLQTEDRRNTSFQGRGSSTPQLDGPSTSGREDSGSGIAEADYTVQLTTSNEDRASLSFPNAGIMLSLIGEGGEALVQRILPVQEDTNPGSERFQRGAVDVVHFRGPNVGRISALWIAPEAGTWQLGQVTVIMMPCEKQGEQDLTPKKGLCYIFNAKDIRLGDGEDTSAAELKPSQVLECNGPEDPAVLAVKTPNEPPKTPQDSARLREASMREYEALKLFLLGSTAGMVGVGTLGLYLLGAQDMAQGFAVGGAAGLVYLFLIQRAVDQIPGPDQPQNLQKNGSVYSNLKVKTPAASFALFVGVALVVTRASQASTVINLPPQELLAGVLGFFTSKIAVFLAAFRSSEGENDSK
ncbi:hypothetical protein M758_1G140800 [Ceratodon purpureus]|nr:hypothetical protein M758_1G140800 [Ceratodon purpureus]